jgi:hypothetical protein
LKAVVFELSDIKNVHDGAVAAGFSWRIMQKCLNLNANATL